MFPLPTPFQEPPFWSTQDGIVVLMFLMFLVLVALGFMEPIMHVLSGLVGLFFAFLVFELNSSLPLAGVISAASIILLLRGLYTETGGVET